MLVHKCRKLQHPEQHAGGLQEAKNTIRQLQNVMNIMSDAKISQQDLYLLHVDFGSTINAIDHVKLICITVAPLMLVGLQLRS